MFDTHCHLNLPFFDKNYFDVIEKARNEGVSNILIPGVDIKTSKKAIEIAQSFNHVYAAAGIHPTVNLEEDDLAKNIFQLEELISSSDRVVAVGEIGLDYYHLNTPARIQKLFLKEQFKLAIKYDKAIILHSRHSSEDIIPVLNEVGLENIKGKTVFHCCEPIKELLNFSIKNRIYIGVDGDVTYDNEKAEFIKQVPLDLLILETDSPYLTPEPIRSHNIDKDNNEPKYIKYIAQKVADIKGIGVERLKKVTSDNAFRFFNIQT
jgi:TatD DNase family protein